MRLFYGTFGFPVNGCRVTTRTRVVLSDMGRPLRYVLRADVTAYLDGAGQTALTAVENAARAALLVPYKDLTLLQDSGLATGTNLPTASSISGCRVVDGPHFENEAADGEYVVQRVCKFACEAEYVIPGTAAAYVSFTETVSIVGNCGPVKRWRPCVNVSPVLQIVSPASTCRAFQVGTAVGHGAYPPAANPIWPGFLHVERSRVTRGNPERPGPNGFVNYPVSWAYEFEAGAPLVGLPGLPPL